MAAWIFILDFSGRTTEHKSTYYYNSYYKVYGDNVLIRLSFNILILSLNMIGVRNLRVLYNSVDLR